MEQTEKFELVSDYQPTGDQPQAIERLAEGVLHGDKEQTLLGVTGSGKTFTMANIIQKVNRPTLVLAHNKTLAAQLCSEFKAFFPNNAVEYCVSYYDYYQPEAYIANTDTYIEKDSAINDEIESCAIRQPPLCPSGGTSSSSPACPVSIRWVTQSTTATWSSPCGPGCARSGTN